MPVPAIIGLVLIIGIAAVMLYRRFRLPDRRGNPPGEGLHGTHWGGADRTGGGPD